MTHRPRLAIAGTLLAVSFGCSNLGLDTDTDTDINRCSARGTGAIDVRITGLPSGVDANLRVDGPSGSRVITSSTRYDDEAGEYSLTPSRVTDSDPTVSTLFEYQLINQAPVDPGFCLFEGETSVVEMAYTPIGTSQHLWIHNSNGNGTGDLLGFSGPALAANAEVEPSVSVLSGAGKDIAFDPDGNLWSLSAAPTRPHLLHYPREELNASAEQRPDVGIDIAGVECSPALRAFAIAPSGVLWVSTCGGRVVGLTPNQLKDTGYQTPELSIDGLDDNGDLAFDSSRNLWITAAEQLVRIDGERLAAVVNGPPDAALTIQDAGEARNVVPSNLAFDTAGDLWVIDAGGKRLYEVAASDLVAPGARSVVATIGIALGMSALPERPAFDESGGLWLALDQNRFGRLAPAQLSVSTSGGELTSPATIITSPGMGNANRMAFFPAPAGLPLYHRHSPP